MSMSRRSAVTVRRHVMVVFLALIVLASLGLGQPGHARVRFPQQEAQATATPVAETTEADDVEVSEVPAQDEAEGEAKADRAAFNANNLGAHYTADGLNIDFNVYSSRATRIMVYIYKNASGFQE